MPTDKKKRLVQELEKRIENCTIAVTTGFTAIPVREITELRQILRTNEIEYVVVKNTLLRLAAQAAGQEGLSTVVEGPTAIAFGYNEPARVAKTLAEYIKTTRSKLTIQGAFLDHQVLSAQEVSVLANLPSRAELLAMLLGQMQAPIVKLLSVLQSPIRGLATVLAQREKQIGNSHNDST